MSPSGPSIVIVDDAADVRVLMKSRLRISGMFTIVGEGADGAQAIELACRHRPDLMLLDVSMPGVDGLEALPEIRRLSPTTRVVLFSGFEEQGLAERAEELGAAAFVEKSTPVDTLVDRLLAVADRSRSAVDPTEHAPEPEPDQRVLDEHLERFREVFDAAAIGMATMTLAGRLVRANGALATLVQQPADRLVGQFYGDLTDQGAQAVTRVLEEVEQGRAEVVQVEHALPRSAGGRWVRATFAPVRDSAGRALYVFLQVQDVTAERAATEELRRSEERFRLLVEAVEDYAIFMLDPTGHVVSWNSGAQRSKLYAADEIIGQHFRVFYPREQQERRHPEHELEIAMREGHYEEEGWRIRKDGTRFWANVLITAVFNESGRHVGFAKVTRDTSERRRLEQDREQAVRDLAAAKDELESLNQRLRQAAEDQQEFLAVTAHELRTPIGVLSGSAETLSRHWNELEDDERGDLLDAVESSTGRLRRLLADLLTASRLESRALEMDAVPVRVVDVVGDAVASLQTTNPGVPVHVDCPEDLTVSGDRDRLSQALDNLLSNALSHGAAPVTVTARSDGDRIQVRVSDAGGGVPAAMQGRLFERFATGRRRGGTGLGLFIVREIARAHGGDATYEPGTTEDPVGAFVITLPVVHPRPTSPRLGAGRRGEPGP
ncbi:PAS domain S-box protein [Nocardioides sp. MAHUQ-72]|uniref:PAS domain S-box protein n=1 Tax=unclassified Nocardioides TaxID=2615069 RepID=UPI003622529B